MWNWAYFSCFVATNHVLFNAKEDSSCRICIEKCVLGHGRVFMVEAYQLVDLLLESLGFYSHVWADQ